MKTSHLSVVYDWNSFVTQPHLRKVHNLFQKNVLHRVRSSSSSFSFHHLLDIPGARGGVVVKGLRYKPSARGFDSRWCQDFSPWHYPAGRTMALGSTHPLTEMSTRCVSRHQVKAAGAYGWQPTTITVPLSRKLGALTLLDASGPTWPVGGRLYLFYLDIHKVIH